MHKYPEYRYTSYDIERPRRRRLAATLTAFVSAGFLLGLILVVLRNLYLIV